LPFYLFISVLAFRFLDAGRQYVELLARDDTELLSKSIHHQLTASTTI
jgi:hypothetical protein